MIRTALLLTACLLLSTKVLAADPAIPVASPGDFTWRVVQAIPHGPDCEGISETFKAAMSALLDDPHLGQVRDGSRHSRTAMPPAAPSAGEPRTSERCLQSVAAVRCLLDDNPMWLKQIADEMGATQR